MNSSDVDLPEFIKQCVESGRMSNAYLAVLFQKYEAATAKRIEGLTERLRLVEGINAKLKDKIELCEKLIDGNGKRLDEASRAFSELKKQTENPNKIPD